MCNISIDNHLSRTHAQIHMDRQSPTTKRGASECMQLVQVATRRLRRQTAAKLISLVIVLSCLHTLLVSTTQLAKRFTDDPVVQCTCKVLAMVWASSKIAVYALKHQQFRLHLLHIFAPLLSMRRKRGLQTSSSSTLHSSNDDASRKGLLPLQRQLQSSTTTGGISMYKITFGKSRSNSPMISMRTEGLSFDYT